MDNKLFAVIDTNVLVSALISKSLTPPPLVVLAHVYSGDITPVFNDEIIQEYRDVLSREKFHLDRAAGPCEQLEPLGHGLLVHLVKI